MIGWPFRRRPEPVPPPLDAAAIVRRARRLRFRVRPEGVSALAGAYLGARPGTGLTFAELKAYEPGDDVRHLDWNVTARHDRPYVRRYVEERSLTLHLVVDISASLRFGPEGRTKADRAAQSAALLAAAAIQNGDRAALTLVSDRVEAEVRPGGGPRHLSRLLRVLVATPASSRRTDLAAGLGRMARSGRRSLVVVLSDFLDPGPVAPWRALSRRHDLVAIRLIEPREESLPTAGLVDIEDPETGRRRTVDAGSRSVRDHYAAEASRRKAEFARHCAEADARGVEAATDEDPLAPLLRHFRGSTRR